MGLLAPVSQPPPAAHARLPGQVASGEYVGKACVAQQGLHGGFLIVAVFQQQPTAGIQVGGGAADDDAQVIQSVGAGRQGLRRLEAQVALLQVVVVGRDVGGVGDDQVEASGACQWMRWAPRAFAFRCAMTSASGERSTACTSVSGASSARVMAMMPLPVPSSSRDRG